MDRKIRDLPFFVFCVLSIGFAFGWHGAMADASLRSGQGPSPAELKTPLGTYKAHFSKAVGALWHRKVDQFGEVIGTGKVRIQYTIFADGTITTHVLDYGSPSMQILLKISLDSIKENSPFTPFSDELKKAVGDSFTDDFSFSVDTTPLQKEPKPGPPPNTPAPQEPRMD